MKNLHATVTNHIDGQRYHASIKSDLFGDKSDMRFVDAMTYESIKEAKWHLKGSMGVPLDNITIDI